LRCVPRARPKVERSYWRVSLGEPAPERREIAGAALNDDVGDPHLGGEEREEAGAYRPGVGVADVHALRTTRKIARGAQRQQVVVPPRASCENEDVLGQHMPCGVVRIDVAGAGIDGFRRRDQPPRFLRDLAPRVLPALCV
jgi:hypothetical protein